MIRKSICFALLALPLGSLQDSYLAGEWPKFTETLRTGFAENAEPDSAEKQAALKFYAKALKTGALVNSENPALASLRLSVVVQQDFNADGTTYYRFLLTGTGAAPLAIELSGPIEKKAPDGGAIRPHPGGFAWIGPTSPTRPQTGLYEAKFQPREGESIRFWFALHEEFFAKNASARASNVHKYPTGQTAVFPLANFGDHAPLGAEETIARLTIVDPATQQPAQEAGPVRASAGKLAAQIVVRPGNYSAYLSLVSSTNLGSVQLSRELRWILPLEVTQPLKR